MFVFQVELFRTKIILWNVSGARKLEDDIDIGEYESQGNSVYCLLVVTLKHFSFKRVSKFSLSIGVKFFLPMVSSLMKIQQCSSMSIHYFLFSIILYTCNSDSNQESIFDHDRLIGLQKSIFRCDHRFSIIYDRSFYFPMIDFFFGRFSPCMYGWILRSELRNSDLEVYPCLYWPMGPLAR